MNKKAFISKVSKIKYTSEDEFSAECNSPELIWKKVLNKAMFWNKIMDEKPKKDGQYLTFSHNGELETIELSAFTNGEFLSAYVTHWAHITKP